MASRSSSERPWPRLTDRLALGSRGLSVSPVCLGATVDPDTVAAAFEAGINFFFVSADMHWPYYEPLRRGLARLLRRRGTRERIVVAGVSYVAQPEFGWRPFKEVVEAIPRLERLDLTVAGGAKRPEWHARKKLLAEHLARGYLGIRAVGASFHDRPAAARALNAGAVDVAFARYNTIHTGARQDLFPALSARRRGKLYNFNSVIGFVPHERFRALGVVKGAWRPEVPDHYRFALTRPEVDGVLCGLRTPAEVEALRAALERGPLAPDEEQYLIDLTTIDLRSQLEAAR